MERRDFLKTVSAGAGVSVAATGFLASVPGHTASAQQPPRATPAGLPEETIRGDMRYRTLGRTGEQVSLFGLGGYHIGIQKRSRKASASSARPSIAASISSTTRGTITAAKAKSAWARPSRTATATRSS